MANPSLIYLMGKYFTANTYGMQNGIPFTSLEVADGSTLDATELVVAGNFSTTTGWTAVNATLSVSGNKGTATETSASVTAAGMYQAITTVIGRRYRIAATYLGSLSSNISGLGAYLTVGTSVGGSQVGVQYASTYTGDETLTMEFVAVGTTTYVGLYARSTSAVVGASVWQNATLKEVQGGIIYNRGTTYLQGDVYLGGILNYVKVARGGHMTMTGTATVFDDLNFGLASSGGPAATLPDYVSINNVVHREFTSANNQLCGDTQELPHSYKLSSTIYPHVHIFLKSGESAGTTGVTFTLYWELRQSTGTTSGSVTLAATSAQLGTTAGANKLDIYDSTGFAGAAEMGAQLALKLARTGGDAGDVVVTTYGVHYEIDSIGSNTATSKT